jgi:uncharacterized protein YsxB (DUF464 family)
MEGERIVAFDARDHAGYAEEGHDIVCAAISSAVNLVHATVNQVLGLAAAVKVDPETGYLSFHLPGGLSELDEATCQNLLTGLMVYLSDLQSEYPEYLDVNEESPEDMDELPDGF